MDTVLDAVTQVQILGVTACISHSVNTPRKAKNPIVLSPSLVGQTELLNFGMASSQWEVQLWI